MQAGTTHQRIHAGQHLGLSCRFRQEVVGTSAQGIDDVLFLVARGDEDHRQARVPGIAKPVQHFQPGLVRQVPVEDQQVDRFHAKAATEIAGMTVGPAAQSGRLQPVGKQARLVWIILQQAHHAVALDHGIDGRHRSDARLSRRQS